MKFTKVIALMTAVFLLVGVTAGCAKEAPQEASETKPAAAEEKTTAEKNGKATEEAASSQEKVTITHAIWNATQAELLGQMAEEFEKETNIHVEFQTQGWGAYWTGLEAAATGGSLPDVFWMHTSNFYYYASNGQLMDLSDRIAASDKVDMVNYPEGLVDLYKIDDAQYAMPKDYDTIGLWYNKTMFDEAGLDYPDETWTWDTLYDAAKKLTKDDGSQYGFMAGFHAQEGYYNTIFQAGGQVIDGDRKAQMNTPEAVEGVNYYFNMVHEGLSPEIYDNAERVEAFENGLTAMGFYGSWRMDRFLNNDYVRENCDVAILPSANDGTRATVFNGLGNAIAHNSKNADAAWQWVEYMSSEEGMTRAAEIGLPIPAYKGLGEVWEKSFPEFNAGAYHEMLEYSHIFPHTNQTNVWLNKMQELLKNAYGGSEDVQEACDKVTKAMDELIAQE